MVERDANGRFLPGNKVGKGNNGGRPRRSVEEQFLKRLRSAVSKADFDTIMDVWIANAMSGREPARKNLMAYLIGMPTQYVNMDATVEHSDTGLLTDAQRAAGMADLVTRELEAGRSAADESGPVVADAGEAE